MAPCFNYAACISLHTAAMLVCTHVLASSLLITAALIRSLVSGAPTDSSKVRYTTTEPPPFFLIGCHKCTLPLSTTPAWTHVCRRDDSDARVPHHAPPAACGRDAARAVPHKGTQLLRQQCLSNARDECVRAVPAATAGSHGCPCLAVIIQLSCRDLISLKVIDATSALLTTRSCSPDTECVSQSSAEDTCDAARPC